MPYYIRKAPNRDLYWVITRETKKKHSKQPIPLEKAQAQLRILNQQLTGLGIFQSKAQVVPIMRPELTQKIKKSLKAVPLQLYLNKLAEIFQYYNVPIDLPTTARVTHIIGYIKDSISMEQIQVGDYIVDFNNEYDDFKRTMTLETFVRTLNMYMLENQAAISPYDRNPIDWRTFNIYKITSADPDSGVPRRRGRGLENTQIHMSLFPALMSANSLNTARNFYKQILRTQKEKDDLNHYINLVTRGHYKKFEEISCLNDLKHIIELIRNYKPLNASASSFEPKEQSLLPRGLLD